VSSYCLKQPQLINAVNEEILIDLHTSKAEVSLLKSQNGSELKG
jgi:hypothetical protein